MAEYCDNTDLPVDQCAHCKGVELVAKVNYRKARIANRFTAQFDGRGACGHPIEEGDSVAYTDDDALICRNCAVRS